MAAESDHSDVTTRRVQPFLAEKRADSSSCEDSSTSVKRFKASSEVRFDLAEIKAEIAKLLEDPPVYVKDIGELCMPKVVCRGHKLLRPTSDGPWTLTLSIRGKEGDPAYGYFFPIILRFEPDLWPKQAVIRFRGTFHHALTDDENGMITSFYRNMPRNEKGVCCLRFVLEHVHRFLVDPLKACDFGDKKSDPKLVATIRHYEQMSTKRSDLLSKYRRLRKHCDLFETWKNEWFHPAFLHASGDGRPGAWKSILREHLPGEVYSFPLFTESFCSYLLEEIFNFYDSDLPARRPNSMNNYGIILNEIGLEPRIDELQARLQPIGELLWPLHGGDEWDGHHCFIVRYRAGEDLGLDMHTDDSDVTFNVCLGLDFKGAGLQFCGMVGAPNHRKHSYTYQHVKGHCVVHLGRKRHGADDITEGERLNLILWNHSSIFRSSHEYLRLPYKKEDGPPDGVCVSYTHDRDFGNFKPYPIGKEHFRGRGWCPRRLYEYDQFTPDCEKEHLPRE